MRDIDDDEKGELVPKTLLTIQIYIYLTDTTTYSKSYSSTLHRFRSPISHQLIKYHNPKRNLEAMQ
jgi:hypothetical protein